jgi:hypothetical protein
VRSWPRSSLLRDDESLAEAFAEQELKPGSDREE